MKVLGITLLALGVIQVIFFIVAAYYIAATDLDSYGRLGTTALWAMIVGFFMVMIGAFVMVEVAE